MYYNDDVCDAVDYDYGSYVPDEVYDCEGEAVDWYDEFGVSISDFF